MSTKIPDSTLKYMRRAYMRAIKDATVVVQKRYMGDNNREDMEVKRCVEDLKKVKLPLDLLDNDPFS